MWTHVRLSDRSLHCLLERLLKHFSRGQKQKEHCNGQPSQGVQWNSIRLQIKGLLVWDSGGSVLWRWAESLSFKLKDRKTFQHQWKIVDWDVMHQHRQSWQLVCNCLPWDGYFYLCIYWKNLFKLEMCLWDTDAPAIAKYTVNFHKGQKLLKAWWDIAHSQLEDIILWHQTMWPSFIKCWSKLHLRERTSFQTVNFHKQRTITPECILRYGLLSNFKKTLWYLTLWQVSY